MTACESNNTNQSQQIGSATGAVIGGVLGGKIGKGDGKNQLFSRKDAKRVANEKTYLRLDGFE